MYIIVDVFLFYLLTFFVGQAHIVFILLCYISSCFKQLGVDVFYLCGSTSVSEAYGSGVSLLNLI